MCLLSVIVPVYNAENYLEQCIKSIINQTYEKLEIILVDDGSTDSSGEICRRYAEQDKRITVISKSNEGPVLARFCGIMQATGECLTFVDADDWIAEDAYEYALQKMGVAEIYATGIYRYFNAEKVLKHFHAVKCGYYNKEGIEKEIIPQMLWCANRDSWGLDPSLCTKIFRRKNFVKHIAYIKNLKVHYADDTAVIYPLMLVTESIVIDDKLYYFHRQRTGDMVKQYLYEDDFIDKLHAAYSYLKKLFQESIYWDILKEQLEHFYLNSVNLKRTYFKDYHIESQAVFPFWKIKKDARVVLYGAGEYGKQYFEQNEQYRFCDIVLWVDKNYDRLNNSLVTSPSKIMESEYDYIILGTGSAGIARELLEILQRQGIQKEKIVWSAAQTKKLP